LTTKVAVSRLALGAQMSMMARDHTVPRQAGYTTASDHPRLDQMFLADIREESIYEG